MEEGRLRRGLYVHQYLSIERRRLRNFTSGRRGLSPMLFCSPFFCQRRICNFIRVLIQRGREVEVRVVAIGPEQDVRLSVAVDIAQLDLGVVATGLIGHCTRESVVAVVLQDAHVVLVQHQVDVAVAVQRGLRRVLQGRAGIARLNRVAGVHDAIAAVADAIGVHTGTTPPLAVVTLASAANERADKSHR